MAVVDRRRSFWQRCFLNAWDYAKGALDSAGRILTVVAILGIPTVVILSLNRSPWGLGIGIGIVLLICLEEGTYRTWHDDQVELRSLRGSTLTVPTFRRTGTKLNRHQNPDDLNFSCFSIALVFSNGPTSAVDFQMESARITMEGKERVTDLQSSISRTVLPNGQHEILIGDTNDINWMEAPFVSGSYDYSVLFWESGTAHRFRLRESVDFNATKDDEGRLGSASSTPTASEIEVVEDSANP